MSKTTSSICPRCGGSLVNRSVDNLCAKCLGELNFTADTMVPDAAGTDSLPPLTPAEVAALFPQLEVLEFLGRGGMGVVYKARQRALGRLVALKLLAPERVADPRFAERFAREAQALAALNHPNIVTIHDFGQAGDMYYLLMEYVDGVNLRQAMTAGRFTPEQALAIVPPVCEALQYAHEHGIVHRDIKPENLLLDKEGRVKIADFGIAKMLGADVDTTAGEVGMQAGTQATVAGTPQYMAPEQKAHHRTDHRADIYSLGVVLYELLTGELPADKLQPPSRRVQIDVRLDGIVLRALEKTPELRYQTAREFRTQVETVTNDARCSPVEPAETAATDATTATAVPTRFSRTAIAGACLVAMGLLSLFLSFFIDRIASRPMGATGVMGPNNPATSTAPAMIGATLIYAFFATLLGWIAVTQIRRSAGKIDGLWLAVFDGLFFPLFALDALILIPLGAVTRLIQPSDVGLVPAWLILFLAVLGIGTVVLIAIVDFFIVRAVWRAAACPTNAFRTVAASSSNHLLLASIALALALLSAALGSVASLSAFVAWPMMALSVVVAGLAILVALPPRKRTLAKVALAIAAIGIAIWPLIGLAMERARANQQGPVATRALEYALNQPNQAATSSRMPVPATPLPSTTGRPSEPTRTLLPPAGNVAELPTTPGTSPPTSPHSITPILWSCPQVSVLEVERMKLAIGPEPAYFGLARAAQEVRSIDLRLECASIFPQGAFSGRLDLYPCDAAVDMFLRANPIPLALTTEDLRVAWDGQWMKVYYWPHSKPEPLSRVESVTSTQANPQSDERALEQARQSGRILAVLRLQKESTDRGVPASDSLRSVDPPSKEGE